MSILINKKYCSNKQGGCSLFVVFLLAMFILVVLYVGISDKQVSMREISGTYHGSFLLVDEEIVLSDNGTYVHKVNYGETCLLYENGSYSIKHREIELVGFTVFIHYKNVLNKVCPTNGLQYTCMRMLFLPDSVEHADRLAPWPEIDFFYSRKNANGTE